MTFFRKLRTWYRRAFRPMTISTSNVNDQCPWCENRVVSTITETEDGRILGTPLRKGLGLRKFNSFEQRLVKELTIYRTALMKIERTGPLEWDSYHRRIARGAIRRGQKLRHLSPKKWRKAMTTELVRSMEPKPLLAYTGHTEAL